MSYKPEHKHLTVLGFAGQKTNSGGSKAGKRKMKNGKEEIVDTDINASSVVSTPVENITTAFNNDMEGLNLNKTSHDLIVN